MAAVVAFGACFGAREPLGRRVGILLVRRPRLGIIMRARAPCTIVPVSKSKCLCCCSSSFDVVMVVSDTAMRPDAHWQWAALVNLSLTPHIISPVRNASV